MNQLSNEPENHSHDEGREVHIHQPNSPLRMELVSHLPFSVGSVAIGLAVVGLICFMAPAERDLKPVHSTETEMAAAHDGHDHGAGCEHDHSSGFRPLFHLFHPLHMFFSAAATTAMFWRYDRRWIRAVAVGMTGSIVICGISDIFMPHIALPILHESIPLHVCVIEHPGLVLPFAIIGVMVGLLAAQGVSQSTVFSHSLHVFTSTMASILYMVQAYGRLGWIDELGWIFFFVILAVMVPCCLSDIVFPIAMSAEARKQYSHSACCH